MRRTRPFERFDRRRLIALIAVGVVIFVAIAVVLARWLSVENAERAAVARLLAAQVAGDRAGMLAELDGCGDRPACAEAVRADAARLRADEPEKVRIAAYESGTAYALGAQTGPTRVVWTVPGRLPTVQCVGVRREGNVLTGLTVRLQSISRPIRRTAAC